MTICEAILTLKLESHFSTKDLIDAYRSMVKAAHPDTPDGDHHLFIKVKEAYDTLKDKADNSYYASTSRTVTGEALSDLGKGMPDKSASDCDHCKGAGYTSRNVTKYSDCPHCKGHGTICCDCGGTGKFKQKNSGRIVDCKTCSGTGHKINYDQWHKIYRSQCLHCWGTGHGYFQGSEVEHLTCTRCKGTGAIECFNPVLQKLAILRGTLRK